MRLTTTLLMFLLVACGGKDEDSNTGTASCECSCACDDGATVENVTCNTDGCCDAQCDGECGTDVSGSASSEVCISFGR